MDRPRQFGHAPAFAGLAVTLCVVTAGAAAQESNAAEARIYQQRTADGRIVLTDRPLAGAVTQRTWQTAPEDADAARQRREEARLEALAVNERIQRQLEAEREQSLALARLQRSEAETRLVAEQARADAAPTVVYVPAFVRRPLPRRPHIPLPKPPRPRMHHGPRRGFGMDDVARR
jgi:predicted membrane chloride channel (bestrophin family)